jgi:hypothetical protein
MILEMVALFAVGDCIQQSKPIERWQEPHAIHRIVEIGQRSYRVNTWARSHWDGVHRWLGDSPPGNTLEIWLMDHPLSGMKRVPCPRGVSNDKTHTN